jgi:hypothetical protein
LLDFPLSFFAANFAKNTVTLHLPCTPGILSGGINIVQKWDWEIELEVFKLELFLGCFASHSIPLVDFS